MKSRMFAGIREVSEVGLGTWQLGGAEWGDVTDESALDILRTAADCDITMIDTADIYGQGRSETLIGKFLRERTDRDRFFIATKLGRSSTPGWPENFLPATIRQHVEDSLQRLGVEALDLIQTHCIPPEITRENSFWEPFRELQHEGKIKAFGASVESVAEAKDCLQIAGLSSLQIIFNVFRQKPIDAFFATAQQKNVALIVRLPLASGLLSGRMSRDTQFLPTDHRAFNRDGQAFNVGETFAGLPFATGLEIIEELRPLVPSNMSMAEWALRWCLDFPAVTTVIPGATRAEQVAANARASSINPLPAEVHQQLRELYATRVAPHIRGKY
jgi:aryl-alcohol dehydrogenase-like predicted oxidoreductase